jgi:hypothetical protein
MVVVFYISSHGFGHATRDIELVNAIARQRPDARIVVRSAVSAAFIEAAAHRSIDVQPVETDTGVVQIDSLELDEEETVRRAGVFYADFASRVDAEAGILRGLAATIVLGDIPPLAFAAAARAAVPSIALGNFTWDWIYEAYPQFERLAPDVLPLIRKAYRTATLALRLPLHGGFEPMSNVIEDIPLIARHSRHGRENTRRLLGLSQDAIVSLPSFGAYGTTVPYLDMPRHGTFTVVVTAHEVADHQSWPESDRFLRLPVETLAERDLRYPDLIAAADVVVTKPGYGIVSECIANGASLLYTSRGRFPEHDVFVREMPRVLRCRYISQDDLRAGRWSEGIDALLRQPPPPERLETNGADVAAARILAEAGG